MIAALRSLTGITCAALLVSWNCFPSQARAEGPILAVFSDGSRVEGTKVEGWFDHEGKPAEIKLSARSLFDPAKPVRFLRDNELAIKPAVAYLEMTGGDILPGRIEEVQPGGFDGESPRILVSVESPLFAADYTRGRLPIRAERVARVVGQRSSRLPLRPGQLQYLDGRTIEFRAARWTREGLRLLGEGGVNLVRFGEIAEVALPLKNAAEGALADSRWAAAWGKPWLMRVETANGAILTAPLSILDIHRVPGRDRRGRTTTSVEFEYLQPAWSLAAIRFQQDHAAIRGFRAVEEVPLSLLPGETLARKAVLGVTTSWQRNRTLQGSYLASGDKQADLGLAIPSYTEAAFDLPPGAKEFRGSVGLDRAMGAGGCAQAKVFRDAPNGDPLWQSGFLQGKDAPVSVGPLAIGGAKRLVLVTDYGHQGRPAGADPFDIRDELVWLHPSVSIDRAVIDGPGAWKSAIAGLEDWQTDAPANSVKTSRRWSLAEERWDTTLAPPDAGLALRRSQRITARTTDILELTLAIFASEATKDIPELLKAIELKADGEVISPRADIENPLRWTDAITSFSLAAQLKKLAKDQRFKPVGSIPIWWDLQKYRGRDVSLTLTLRKPPGGEFRWRELKLRGAAAVDPEKWPSPQVSITSLQPVSVSSHKDRGHPAIDKSPYKPLRELTFLGQQVTGGYGMMRNSHLSFELKPEYRRFTALVGTCLGKVGPYRVLFDDKPALTIPPRESEEPAVLIDLPIPPGAKRITIEVGEIGGYTGFGAFAPAGFASE